MSENKGSTGKLLLFRVAFAVRWRISLRVLRNSASPPGRETQLQVAYLRFIEILADPECAISMSQSLGCQNKLRECFLVVFFKIYVSVRRRGSTNERSRAASQYCRNRFAAKTPISTLEWQEAPQTHGNAKLLQTTLLPPALN